jgi:hypothetical protein
LSISGGNTVSLANLLDNTDVLASLACSIGQVAQWNGSGWVCANASVDTDDQTLSLIGNSLAIDTGNSVNLAGYLDNTDAQALSLGANVLSISGSAGTINLAPYLDNTDAQTLSLASNTLSLVSGGSVNLSAYLDNTDSQDLNLSSNILSLTGDGTTVDLTPYLDNTDSQNLFFSFDAPSGTDPSADTATDTLSFVNGSGVTITGDGTTDSITIAATLGTAIDSAEIVDGTIVFADLASNGCSNGQIFKFNGSAWYCGTDVDTDTTLNEAQVEAYIFDADNVGTLSSGTLALDSIAYTGTIDDVNINDALTISSAGSVADGALSANVSLLGSSIDSSEISNGTITGTDLASATILFSNIAQNGCSTNQIMKWNGTAWACANDVDTDTDAQNLFQTINADNGTDPQADSVTDTLNVVSGSGVVITGDGTTDTLTIASTLGVAIDSAEIVDGTIVSADISDGSVSNTDLANSSLTVTAGTGLTGGGSVSLGGTVTLNLANDFGSSIDSSEITNGTILTADIGASQITSALIANATILNEDIADATIANAKLVNSAVTINTSTGLSGGGTVALGASLSLTSTLGTDIDTSEITNGTILFADIASNACGTGAIIEYNGSSWVCGTDDGITSEVDGSVTNELQNLFETISTPAGTNPVADGLNDTLNFVNGSGVTITGNGTTDSITIAATLGTDIDSSEIVNGTVANADLANSSVTINTSTGLSGGGSVALGGTLNLTSTLGTDIDSAEIVNGTIVLADFSDFGCGTNQTIKYNGSAWVCATDLVDDADASATNELQNIFLTIDAPNGTDPSADSTTDTLAFADGAGITITGNSTTDTVTIASVLGTSVDSSEITDGTITGTDVASATIANSNLANSSLTVTAGTGLSGGGAVSLGGTVTLNSALGTSIDSAEIVNGTIITADIAVDAITSALILNGVIVDEDIANTTISNAKLVNSAVTITAGTGLSGGGAVALGSSVSLSSTLGTSIDTSEITNGTILFADIASNGCGVGAIIEYDGSDWVCGSDDVNDADSSATNEIQNLFETISTPAGTSPIADSSTDTLAFANGAGISITGNGTTDTITVAATLGVEIDTSEIVDGTITGTDIASGTVANGNLVNSSLTVTAGTGLSGGGAVSLGGSVSLSSALGTSIDSSEIVDGAIILADFSDFGCGTNQIIKYNGSAWVCATDLVDDADASATNELQNLFLTFDTPNGTDPSADNTTDTLAFADGTGITITGNSTTDTVTIASVLGTTIDSSEIVDGTITGTDIASGTVSNSSLANSSLTVTAGTGLTGGGSVSLGGTVTLNLANDFGSSIDSSEITNGTILFADIASNGCGTNAIFKYNGSAWVCGTDVDTDTDAQDLTRSGNTLSLTGDGTTVDLSIYLDDTDTQDLSLASNTLSLVAGGSVDLSSYLDNTDSQDLSLSSNILSLTGDGTTVDLSSYLDNTDNQNVFFTIDAPNGTDPSADTATDTLSFVDGAGITITGNGTTDAITIASTLGASVETGEIVDGTITGTDIASTTVANANLVNSAVTVTAGTGLTGGGSVSLGGTVTLNLANDFGSSIDSSEITNGTILFADIGQNGCGTNDIIKWNGSAWACATDSTGGSVNSFETLNADNGTDPVADSSTDTLNVVSGSGVVITGDSTTDTLTVAAVLGTTVDSSEITDGTITGTDVSDGSLGNAELANSSLTVTAGSGLTNGGSVALGSTTTLNIGAGNGITVNADDIAVRALSGADGLSSTTSSGSGLEVLASGVGLLQGCANNQILKWNETTDVWACGNDIDTDTDAQNLFFTFNADNGTDPQADGVTDTINFSSGTGVIITGDSTTDTLTIAAVLGTTIDTSEIVDGTITGTDIASGTIANANLVNSGVTVVAGSGLITGGAISLGGTVTLDVGAGTAITVNGNDVAVTADGINYTEIADSLSLDASTTTSLGASTLATNLDSTGDVVFQDNGSAFLTLDDAGSFSYILDATDNSAYTVTNNGSSNVTTNLAGSGDFVIQDNGTAVLSVLDDGSFQFRSSADSATGFVIQDSTGTNLFVIDSTNDRVYVGNPTSDAIGALLVLDTKNTAGDPSGINGSIYYNGALNQNRCFKDGSWQDCSEASLRTTYYYSNDMMAITTDTTISSQVAGTAAANSVAAVVGEPGHPGVVQHQAGTTTTGRAAMAFQNAQTLVLGNNTEWVYESAVRIPVLSDGTNRFTYRAGFIDLVTADPTDGCFMRYVDNVNAGNWQGVCRNNNAESVCNTGIAATTAWIRIGVVVNSAGTSADFRTGGVSRCQVASNIPITTARATAFGSGILKSLGTTSRSVDLDYIEVKARFVNSR